MPSTNWDTYDRPASYYMNQGVDGQPLPTISDRLRSMGMDSSVEPRPMLMPVREDGEWTAPEWFHSLARGAMVPAQAVLGGTVTPLDTAMAMADYAGGGLLSSKAIPNAVPDGSVLGATLWHGSPHKFDKFDMSKIGTGEGVQAYGHGLYFAGNPKVARGYADTGSRNSQFDSGHRYVIRKGNLYDDAFDIEKMHKGAGASGGYESRSSFFDDSFKSKDEALRFLESKGHVPSGSALGVDDVGNYFVDSRKANLYKVDLPDEHIEKMMDWDKPLSEQSKYVREILKKEGYDRERLYDKTPNTWGSDVYQNMMNNIDQRKGLGKRGSSMATAEELKRIGITGIKYLDQGSRGAGEGTSNYVVFDDTLPTILGRE